MNIGHNRVVRISISNWPKEKKFISAACLLLFESIAMELKVNRDCITIRTDPQDSQSQVLSVSGSLQPDPFSLITVYVNFGMEQGSKIRLYTIIENFMVEHAVFYDLILISNDIVTKGTVNFFMPT